jgi:putative ABC transport system substrate-binding protein
MALTSRIPFWLGVIGCAVAALTCAPSPARRGPASPPGISASEEAPTRGGDDAVLVFVPQSTHTREVWQSMRDELAQDFNVVTHPIAAETTVGELEEAMSSVRPRCVVLIGNQSMNLYVKYQKQHAGPYPPAVVLMASFLEEQKSLLKNTTGITYEIPGITTFVKLRSFMYRPVQRVGVIYRPLFANYLKKQRALAAVEQVELVEAQVSDEPGPYQIRRALDRLTRRENVDAIWVLNDNVLLKPELIAKGWLRILHKNPLPVVVGVGSLVDVRLHFGSFAMLPDHQALGMQAANMVFNLSDEDWEASAVPIELPLSVQSVVDLPWVRQHLQFREESLERIDRIVQ